MDKEIHRELIGCLVKECLISMYNQENFVAEKDEVVRLDDNNTEEDLSIFFEVEVFSDTVAGVATTIEKFGTHSDPKTAKKWLDEGNLLNDKRYSGWLIANLEKYPNYCTYILLIDYLRLKVLEYLELYCYVVPPEQQK